MGRVKDYIVGAPPGAWGDLTARPLVTRNRSGVIASSGLVLFVAMRILIGRLTGGLALVHVNFGDRGSAVRKGIVVLAARAFGVPVVLHLHAVQLEREYEGAPLWLRALVRLPFRAATRIIVLGERWRNWLTHRLGVEPCKIDVVWNGVVREGAPSAAAERPREIIFVGNLSERKGVTDLFKALASLSGEAAAWRLTCVGGGDLARYQALADKLGITDRIGFTGWLASAEARAMIAGSGMLVLPSYEEGLPLVILEALGVGTPVICTPVGSIGEVLADGETALFCAPGDPASLAAAISRLARDLALRQRLSEDGLALFATRFSVEAFRASILDVWKHSADIAPVAERSPQAVEHAPGMTASNS